MITALIVQDAHERVGHNRVKETLTEIRRKCWIVKGRSLVWSIIFRCVLCRRFEGVPFCGPPPPPLPMFRVKEEPPLIRILVWTSPVHSISNPVLVPTRHGYASLPVLSPKQYIWTSPQTCPLKPSSGVSNDLLRGGEPHKNSYRTIQTIP